MARVVAGLLTATVAALLTSASPACSSDTFRPAAGPSPDGEAEASAPTCDANTQTDPEHCGTCGRSCLGSACVSGACEPVVLASGLGPVSGLAVRADAVYLAVPQGEPSEVGLFRLDRRAPAGTKPERIDATGGMFALASDGDTLAVANHLNGDSGGGVYRLVGAGAPLTKLSDSQASAVAVTAGAIHYVIDFGREVGGFVDGQHVSFYGDESGNIEGLRSDGGRVFWRQGMLLRGMVGRGSGVVDMIERDGLGDYLVLGDRLYFTHGATEGTVGGSCAGGQVGTAQLLPSLAVEAPVDLVEPCARALAADAAHVYWAQGTFTARPGQSTDVVRRMRKTDRVVETIAVNQTYIEQLVADDEALYWVSVTTPGGASTLTRLVK